MAAEVPFFDRALEMLPRERLRALQWDRLTALAREAFPANPFVSQKWKAAGIR
ncbi:MAG: phenylacetate--CoA ligase, partial [Candidatus Rokubacteria bacterium]|nr:phenylacetate--CoA ligase [Candidatus Rokubacteria bacterium]